MPGSDSPGSVDAQAPAVHLPRPGLVAIALALRMLAGVLLCFITSFPLAIGISVALVITSAALVTLDAMR